MHRDNWDDLRFVIAVAETGTVSAAARRLGVTHGTVLRRIAAFEQGHDRQIFDKSATGYTLLPEFTGLLDAAHEVENAVMGVARAMGGGSGGLRGQVRITSTDSLCQVVLPEAVAQVAAAHPELSLTLISNNAHLDFARQSIDITLRPSVSAPDGLHAIRLCDLAFAVYQHADAEAGLPWLTLEGPLARSGPAMWMSTHAPDAPRGPGSDSFLALRELAILGIGQSFLPAILGDPDPRLTRVTDVRQMSVPLWLACQPELAESPRIRAVLRELQQALAPWHARLEGTAVP